MKTAKMWTILVLALGLLVWPAKLNADDRIFEGNSEVEVIDEGDGYIHFVEDGTELMRISDGRLGIGTTNPLDRLHVYGGNLRVERENTTVSFKGTVYSNGFHSPAVYFYRSRGSKAAPLGLQSNDPLGFFGFVGYDGTGWSGSQAYFQARADGNWSATSRPTNMVFATTPAGSATAQKRMFINNAGNVGIGTISPAYKLDVVGTARVDVLTITGGSDVAEPFDVKETDAVKAGMVMIIDAKNPGKLKVSEKAYDRCVAGIISGAGGVKPGMLMGQLGAIADGEYPVALSGRVYCWADASCGEIQPGNLLTTSDTRGHAMRVTNYTRAQGAVLGKAMSALESGRGLVLVLVTLQ